MIVKHWKCDYCKRVSPPLGIEGTYGKNWSTPEGWIRHNVPYPESKCDKCGHTERWYPESCTMTSYDIRLGDDYGEFHFCSQICLDAWKTQIHDQKR